MLVRPVLKERVGETGVVRDIAVQATAVQGDGAFASGPRPMPWEGRDRLDFSTYPKVDLDIRVFAGRVEMRTPALTVEVQLRPTNLSISLSSLGRFPAVQRKATGGA